MKGIIRAVANCTERQKLRKCPKYDWEKYATFLCLNVLNTEKVKPHIQMNYLNVGLFRENEAETH